MVSVVIFRDTINHICLWSIAYHIVLVTVELFNSKPSHFRDHFLVNSWQLNFGNETFPHV
jgi:hypothetical protein